MSDGVGPADVSRMARWAAGPGSVTLVLGGARSGKSAFAEGLAAAMGDRVVYVATGQALDEEMGRRIAAHRLRRPVSWETVEEPLAPARAIRERGPGAAAVLLDCLTLLVSNLILRVGGAAEAAQAAVLEAVDDLVAAARDAGVPLIVVSNEVGMGVIPEHPLGRVYGDVLGRANQALAARAGVVCLVVAGLPWLLKVPGGSAPAGMSVPRGAAHGLR